MTKKRPKGPNQGLTMMNFHVPPDLYQRFKVRVVHDRATVRAVATALVTAYVKGEFKIVEEKKADPKKG